MVSHCFDLFVLWNTMEPEPANGWDRDTPPEGRGGQGHKEPWSLSTQRTAGSRTPGHTYLHAWGEPLPSSQASTGAAEFMASSVGTGTAVSTAISAESAPAGPGVTRSVRM